MRKLVWVLTSPPEIPGSMAAYADLVRRAVETAAPDLAADTCGLFDPRGGSSMWRHHLWRARYARDLLSRHPADLYHWLDGSMSAFIPPALRPRSLVTVHDLIPLLQLRGELSGRPSLPAAWLVCRAVRALGACAGICVESVATGRDLERLAGLRGSRVIPIAPRDWPAPEPLPDPAPRRFILHVGHNAPYKNRRGVLEVFSLLRDLPDVHLVLAGPAPSPDVRDAAARLARVRFVGPVSDAQMCGLYREAALLLFPSLYEGFGMPVLEAMSAGCPVVCSETPALLETGGNAALSAPAGDAPALAGRCRALLADEGLRRKCIERGRTRAAAFDVASMGRSLIEWYRQALNPAEERAHHV
jgi:glycosyltransferase involved in cell wall biosynthesis